MDEVSAEKTISMWVHDEGLDAPADGSFSKEFVFEGNKQANFKRKI